MRQLTLRGFDKELDRRIRDLAAREGISLNRATLRLLQRGAGIGMVAAETSGNVVGRSLDDWIGTWTQAEAHRFNKAVEAFATIDESMWP